MYQIAAGERGRRGPLSVLDIGPVAPRERGAYVRFYRILVVPGGLVHTAILPRRHRPRIMGHGGFRDAGCVCVDLCLLVAVGPE